MDRLSSIEAFVAVADQRGFAAAARSLRVSPATVTRLVAALEDHLGIRLLTRTTRSVALTDGGARFLERARRLLVELGEAEDWARSERVEPRGTLAVTAPRLFGRMHVARALSDFLTRWPRVVGELQLTDRVVNLVEQGADVAIRIGELPDSSLIARRVGATRRVVVASPDYLRTAPPLISPAELRRHQIIGFTALAPGRTWDFVKHGRSVQIPITPHYVSNSGDAAIDHAERGNGLTLALSYQVSDQVRAGTLVVLLERFEPPPRPIHLLHSSNRLLSSRVRFFLDHVAANCRWDFTRLVGPRRASGRRKRGE